MSKVSMNSKRGFKPRGAFGVPRYRRNSIPNIDLPEFKFGFWLRLRIWVNKIIRSIKRRFQNERI